MRRGLLSAALAICVTTSTAGAAGLYFTGDHSTGDLTILAKESGGAEYWKMVVTGGSTPGRIMEFYDLTGDGNSSPTFNCAHRYTSGSGMLDPIDNDTMRNASRWTLTPGTQTDGASSYTYTLTRNVTDHPPYTNVITMTWTINAPTVDGSQVVVSNNWFFPQDFPGNNGDCRAYNGYLPLYASDSGGAGNEYTHTSYNGPDPDGVGTQWVQMVVNAGIADMAEGRSYRATHTAPLWDLAYDEATTYYDSQVDACCRGRYELGLTGTWAGNPGNPVPADIDYYSITTLDINISAPPAVGGDVVIR